MVKADRFKELLIDEDDLLDQLITRAKQIVKIDRSGNMILLVPRVRLHQKEIAGLALLSHYFAYHLGIVDSEAASLSEIARLSDIAPESLAVRLKELKDRGIVEAVDRGNFKISLAQVGKLLDKVEQELQDPGHGPCADWMPRQSVPRPPAPRRPRRPRA